MSSVQVQISTLQRQVNDAKSQANQLRSNNKTLREELRKVQSSVQLMERQRNPGVGYWSTPNPGSGPSRPSVISPELPTTPRRDSRLSLDSAAESVSIRNGTGRSSPALSEVKDKEEEEVNLEVSRQVT